MIGLSLVFYLGLMVLVGGSLYLGFKVGVYLTKRKAKNV